MSNSYISGLNYELPHPFRADAERLRYAFDTDTIKVEGVLRWRSNNSVPPQDILDFWKHIGKRFNMSLSVAAREREQKAFLTSYRKARANRPTSHEEMYELQAVHGRGKTIIDVGSGRQTRT
jgi:hypothetical protein